jgi:hypothetical protein
MFPQRVHFGEEETAAIGGSADLTSPCFYFHCISERDGCRANTPAIVEVRTHVSLGKSASSTHPIEQFGNIVANPILAGLYYRYVRF